MNNNIDLLIIESNSIRNKITIAMKELKLWFEQKMDKVNDFLDKVTDRVNDSLSKLNRNAVSDRTIRHNGEIVLEKGSDIRAYKNNVSVRLKDLKMETNIVIQDSKRGIRYVINDDKERALYTKKVVMDRFKKVTAIGGLILALAASTKAVFTIKNNNEKKERIKSKFDEMERAKAKVYDVYFDDEEEGLVPAYSY